MRAKETLFYFELWHKWFQVLYKFVGWEVIYLLSERIPMHNKYHVIADVNSDLYGSQMSGKYDFVQYIQIEFKKFV